MVGHVFDNELNLSNNLGYSYFAHSTTKTRGKKKEKIIVETIVRKEYDLMSWMNTKRRVFSLYKWIEELKETFLWLTGS